MDGMHVQPTPIPLLKVAGYGQRCLALLLFAFDVSLSLCSLVYLDWLSVKILVDKSIVAQASQLTLTTLPNIYAFIPINHSRLIPTMPWQRTVVGGTRRSGRCGAPGRSFFFADGLRCQAAWEDKRARYSKGLWRYYCCRVWGPETLEMLIGNGILELYHLNMSTSPKVQPDYVPKSLVPNNPQGQGGSLFPCVYYCMRESKYNQKL